MELNDLLIILTPILVGIISVLAWLYRREWERRYDAEQRISESKIKTYTKLVPLLFNVLQQTGSLGRKGSEKHLIKGMRDAQRELFMFGSDKVLEKFSALLQQAYGDPEGKQPSSLILGHYAELLVALRQDIGNSKSQFSSSDLMRMLITDYDDARKKGEI